RPPLALRLDCTSARIGWHVLHVQVPGSGIRLMMLACTRTSARPSARLRAVTRKIGLWQSNVGGTTSQLPFRPGPVPRYSIQYSGGAARRAESYAPSGTALQFAARPVGQMLDSSQSSSVGICVSQSPEASTT